MVFLFESDLLPSSLELSDRTIIKGLASVRIVSYKALLEATDEVRAQDYLMAIKQLVEKDLSEPYSVFTYR
jgi:hypothetical protein